MQRSFDFFQTDRTVKPRGIDVRVFKPELITKELKLSTLKSGTKRIRLSSNFLPLMGFTPGTRTSVVDLGVNAGLQVTFDSSGATKVYSRTYNQRRNNPLETQIDIQNQTLIDRAIPEDSERLHFTLQDGSIIIKPLYNNSFLIRTGMKAASDKFSAFVAMSSGIDAHCLRACGFSIQSILEYRPREARDKADLTETGAINAISNVKVKYLFNEDITSINWDNVKRITQEDDQVGLLHISIQCDDHSLLKTNQAKKRSIDNLDTSVDQVYDALRLVETIQPATILVENVPGFASSGAADILRIKLRRWGYHVTERVLDARSYKGLTSRKRFYLVASVWPGFEMPEENPAADPAIWPIVERHLANCRDVTHTSTVHLGVKTGRVRLITKESSYAPTITKSQSRQAKDSVYIKTENGQFLFPTEELLRDLNGFPSDINLNSVSSTIASEIIGQSIDYPMHHELVRRLKSHISMNA